MDLCFQIQSADVASFLAETYPEMLTEDRPHPFVADRVVQPINSALAESNKPMLDFLLSWSAPHMDNQSVMVDRLKTGEYVNLGTCTDPDMVKLLVDSGCDVNRRHAGFTTTIGTVFTGFFFAQLAAGSEDSQIQWCATMPGMTALHEAAFRGNIAVVRELLKLGADPRIRNHYGMTPLAVAKMRGLDHVAGEIETALAEWPEESWWCCAAKQGKEGNLDVGAVPSEFVPMEKGERKNSKAISVVSTAASE